MKKIAVGMVIAVTAVLVIAASPVYAHGGNPPVRPGQGNGAPEAAGAQMMAGGQDLEAAAAALGITVEELQAELNAGANVHDLLEAAGVDLADWAQENLYLYDYSAERQVFLAEQLGMTVEELQAALDAGSTVYDLAQAAGIDLPLFDGTRSNGKGMDAGGSGMVTDGPGLYAAGTSRMADALGMTVEELEAEIAAGSTVQDLFTAAGMDFPAGGPVGSGMGTRIGR